MALFSAVDILVPVGIVFRVEQFEGPLDLLLQLVEQEKMDISNVSLAAVADQFLEYVHASSGIPPIELADFLVVAAKLLYLKSRLFLPQLTMDGLDEGPDLAIQLREYQRFVAAARVIQSRWTTGQQSFARPEQATVPRVATEFVPPIGVTLAILEQTMRRVVAKLEPMLRLPQIQMERTMTLQEKIRDLAGRIRGQASMSFHTFMSGARSKTEAVVSFLALLELIKQKFVRVEQTAMFHDIAVKAHPEAPPLETLQELFAHEV